MNATKRETSYSFIAFVKSKEEEDDDDVVVFAGDDIDDDASTTVKGVDGRKNIHVGRSIMDCVGRLGRSRANTSLSHHVEDSRDKMESKTTLAVSITTVLVELCTEGPLC